MQLMKTCRISNTERGKSRSILKQTLIKKFKIDKYCNTLLSRFSKNAC